ncbi:MAG: hypothetical protein OXU67_06145 [Chloroflexota bacterium]|nr:hypothetical protein [Chloroflexota bacterium]
MPNPIDTCPIWGKDFAAKGWCYPWDGMYLIEDSPRAGGAYELTDDAKDWLDDLGVSGKARLTTWIIDQRRQGVEKPRVTTETLAYVKSKRDLPPHERAERLLRCVAEQAEAVGIAVSIDPENYAAYAWSESTRWDDVRYFADYLIAKELIRDITLSGTRRCVVTVDGYGHIAELETNPDSSQAFVAMWINPETDEAYEQGMKKGIEAAGYKPMRIDKKPDVNKIDDEIFAQIRRSRFLVADFTQGEDGARGGVYYEAGFARGLGLEVIYLCREDMKEHLHFDTRQYYHIFWDNEKLDELRENLANRIEARIGAGPNK